jgi:hypothetical protein
VRLRLLPGRYAVARLDPTEAIPAWATRGGFWSITRTGAELSVVCGERDVPDGVTVETGWAILAVVGPLDFGLTGILHQLTAPLAAAELSVFAISTYDTDYLLVRAASAGEAVAALRGAGYLVEV